MKLPLLTKATSRRTCEQQRSSDLGAVAVQEGFGGLYALKAKARDELSIETQYARNGGHSIIQ